MELRPLRNGLLTLPSFKLRRVIARASAVGRGDSSGRNLIEGRRMGTVLSFRGTIAPYPRRDQGNVASAGEVVIFPGVRIERHEGGAAPPEGSEPGNGDYDGVGGKRRPRKSS